MRALTGKFPLIAAAATSLAGLSLGGCASQAHRNNFGSPERPVFSLKNGVDLPPGHHSVSDVLSQMADTYLPKLEKTVDDLCLVMNSPHGVKPPLGLAPELTPSQARAILASIGRVTFAEQLSEWRGAFRNASATEVPGTSRWRYTDSEWTNEFGDPIDSARKFIAFVSGTAVPGNLSVVVHRKNDSLLGRSDVDGFAMPGSNSIDMKEGCWTRTFFVFTHEFGHQASMCGESTGNALLACLDPDAAALEEACSFAWEMAAAAWLGVSNFDSWDAPSNALLVSSIDYLQDPVPSIWAGRLHHRGAALLDAALTVTNGDLAGSYQLLAFDHEIPPAVNRQLATNVQDLGVIRERWERLQERIKAELEK